MPPIPDTNMLVLVSQMMAVSTVVVVRLNGISGGTKEVLGAAFRGQIIVTARVLSNLKRGFHAAKNLGFFTAKIIVTLIDHCLATLVVPFVIEPSWKLRVLQQSPPESMYTAVREC